MKNTREIDAIFAATIWVAVATMAGVAGWGLSAIGQLGTAGYLAAGAAALVGGLWWYARDQRSWRLQPRWRRYRRGYPAIFVTSWLLASVGGALHAPNNIDAMTYRWPRVLHWLAVGGWHRIDTVDPRQNYSACGQEWLIAPFLAVLKSDVGTWLWNSVALLLLPGLLFVVLRGVGVARHVAWRWMWLLPLAPIYLLQAGSVANDLLGAAHFLAALALAFVSRRRGSPALLAASALAIALCTGVKASNLPLVLPWLILIGPLMRQDGFRRALVLVALPALLVSAVPTLWLNRVHTGDWTGDPANLSIVKAGRPVVALAGNAVEAALQNLQPPIFPGAAAVENRLAVTVGNAMRDWMGADFRRFTVHLTELAQEEWAGLGGLMVLLLLGGALVRTGRAKPRSDRLGAVVCLAGVIAALAYFLVMGSEMTARLLAPYYFLLCAMILRGAGQSSWVRRRSFQALAVVAVAGSFVPLVISPARPLVPVASFVRLAASMNRLSADTVAQAERGYEVYAHRADLLHELCAGLPSDTVRVGFMATSDDSEISCWRPFGRREVVTVRATDDAETLRRRQVSWVVIRADALWPNTAGRDTWLKSRGGLIERELDVVAKARRPSPEHWVLARFEHGGV